MSTLLYLLRDHVSTAKITRAAAAPSLRRAQPACCLARSRLWCRTKSSLSLKRKATVKSVQTGQVAAGRTSKSRFGPVPRLHRQPPQAHASRGETASTPKRSTVTASTPPRSTVAASTPPRSTVTASTPTRSTVTPSAVKARKSTAEKWKAMKSKMEKAKDMPARVWKTSRSMRYPASVNWQGALLFIDLANAVGAFGSRKMALQLMPILGRLKGCHVLAMVEGVDRDIPAPRGMHLIRAEPVQRKDVGDDALVKYMAQAIEQGIRASDLILVTDDRDLRNRMRFGVRIRSTDWLRAVVATMYEPEPEAVMDLAFPPGGGECGRPPREQGSLAGVSEDRPVEEGGSGWWRGLLKGPLASLRSLFAAGAFGERQQDLK